MPQEAWKQGQNWWIRTPEGIPVNLNTRQGATFVLDLLRLVEELKKPPRGSGRKKPGPSETK